MGNSIDSILRKVNALPIDTTVLTQTEVKRLLGKWDESLEARWAKSQQAGTLTRGNFIRQLTRQKEMNSNTYRPSKTHSMAVLRRKNAKRTANPSNQEHRIG